MTDVCTDCKRAFEAHEMTYSVDRTGEIRCKQCEDQRLNDLLNKTNSPSLYEVNEKLREEVAQLNSKIDELKKYLELINLLTKRA